MARSVKGANGYYVTYSFLDPETSKHKVFKIRKTVDQKGNTIDLNRASNITEKKALAKQLAFEINELLKDGFNPFGEEYEEVLTIKTALKIAFDSKKAKGIASNTVSKYKNAIKYFEQYTTLVYLSEFKSHHFEDFCNTLIIKRGVSKRTRDNIITIIKSLFNELVTLGQLKFNPIKVKSIVNRKQPSEIKNLAITEKEMDLIFPFLKANNLNLYLMAKLIYFCLIRPNEGRMLQVKHINLKDGILEVPGSLTKTKKSKYPIIPNALKKEIEDLELTTHNPNYYILSNKCKPGESELDRGYFSKNWKILIKEKLGIKKDLYGLKRSGIYAILDDYDIELARYQADHSDISTTGIYAKNKKGMMDNFKRDFGN